MISPWTIYKQKKEPIIKENITQSKIKQQKSIINAQFSNPHLLSRLNDTQHFNQVSQEILPYQTIQSRVSVSSSFLSQLQMKNHNHKNLSQQINHKSNDLLQGLDDLSFLKSITMSLEKDGQNKQKFQQSKRNFRPIRKFSLQNNPQINTQKKLLQKLFNLQGSNLKYNINQSEENLTNNQQNVNSELLAQIFIKRGRKISSEQKYKSKETIQKLYDSDKKQNEKQLIKNEKEKKIENKFFNPQEPKQNKNIKNLIHQILKRHINFNKQPNKFQQDCQNVQNVSSSVILEGPQLNEPIQRNNILLDQKFNNFRIKKKLSNQSKSINQGDNTKRNFKSLKQLFSLREVFLLKNNRQTLSFADKKMEKNLLKYSELKSEQKINKKEKQKSKKIRINLKKIQNGDSYFSKKPYNFKISQKKESSSFYINQMNNSQMKFSDQRIFSQIKYPLQQKNSQKIFQI